MSLVVAHDPARNTSFTWPDVTSAHYLHGGLPKPCVHPLRVAGSPSLTGYQMSDHVWHRGLWFTFKLVNGHNFWEENAPFGVQKSAAVPRVEADASQARLMHELAWTAPDGGVLLDESRDIRWSRGSDGELLLRWTSRLTARGAVTLDRTPFTTWGGYGGLAFRGAREWHEAELLRPALPATTAINGDTAAWVAMNGRFDGGAEERAGILLADHPANPRHPSPIYAKCSGAGFSFANLALLFAEPLALADGETLSLTQLAAFRSGRWTETSAASVAATFASSSV